MIMKTFWIAFLVLLCGPAHAAEVQVPNDTVPFKLTMNRVPDFRLVPGDFVDIVTVSHGIESQIVRQAFVVSVYVVPQVVIIVAVSPENAKTLAYTVKRKATITLKNLNGEPTFGEILEIIPPLSCNRLPSAEDPKSAATTPIVVDLKVNILGPQIYSLPPPVPRYQAENVRITAFVAKRSVCEAIQQGKNFGGKTDDLGKLHINDVFDRSKS